MENKMKVIAIDFDNTIYYKNGKINTCVQKNIKALMDEPNNYIVIYTARQKNQRIFVEGKLDELDIPYHALVMEKMRADIYIDDKNVGGLKWPKIKK
jgi:hydroxymethylpyrimidine pyrophosphatase-like HAD family hydrolase